jgi:hypothetical protein
MRGAKRGLFALGLLALFLPGWPVSAEPKEERPKLVIVVGESKDLHLGYPASPVICDDKSIVSVELAPGDALRVHGLKVGATRCGFWKAHGLPPVVYDVTVVPKPT